MITIDKIDGTEHVSCTNCASRDDVRVIKINDHHMLQQVLLCKTCLVLLNRLTSNIF